MTEAPYDDRDGFIWMDGEMLPWREANLHVLSHGLHYGGSVFEGERVYDGNVFKLEEHTQRLIDSGHAIDMPISQTAEEIHRATYELLEANDIKDGYVRPIAWRGAEHMNVSGHANKVHLAIATWDWPKYFFPKGGDAGGVALKTSSWLRMDPRTYPTQAKTAGIYTVGTMAKHQAERAGYDDALMLDYRGQVAEASGANIFLIKDGEIITPTPDCFLNGITRQTAIKLAKDSGLKVIERAVMPEEIEQADEIFLTGTAAEIAPVEKIDDIIFEIGPVTRTIKQNYADLVRSRQVAVKSA
jgi:branched-chain amino acid aminotransferase